VDGARRDDEERALQLAAAYLAAGQRLATWRWDEPELPPVNELYRRDLARVVPVRGAS